MATFLELYTEVASLGGIAVSDEAASASAWAKGGLRAIARAGAWEWLRAQGDATLAAGTYLYDFETDFFRLDCKTVRYGGSGTGLDYRRMNWIDANLDPDWKDAATANGTPFYCSRFGNQLVVAAKPSAAFVAAHPTLYYYYWRTEAYSGALYLPDEFLEVAVQASLAYGMLQENDGRADSLLQRFNQIYLPEMRGARLDIGSNDEVMPPDWMLDGGSAWAYGDR